MANAFIVQHHTPKGSKLIAATDVRGKSYRPMGRSAAMSHRALEVLQALSRDGQNRRRSHTSLKQLFDAAVAEHGDGRFSPMRGVRYLVASGETPGRVLFEE